VSALKNLAARLKSAQPAIAGASSALKNRLLREIADALEENQEEILRANEGDVSCAAQHGINSIMLDRLALTPERIGAMAAGVRKVAALSDPIGEILSGKTLPNGLVLKKVRVPLGVVGIIYEARPNVTVDAAALCLKASNGVMLRGGKEALQSNMALVRIMQDAIRRVGLNPDIVLLVEDTSRETAQEMMTLNGSLDVLIPRGGRGLIQSVVQNATIPVIETGAGNCHIYVDAFADLEMAASIVYNAKTSRPSVCNACESLLVHEGVARQFLPMCKERLEQKNVILLGCPRARQILEDKIGLATEDDYAAEFLGYVLSVRVVDSLDEAVAHIAKYSTGHSEAIITSNLDNAFQFVGRVDSAAVYVNASTRFTDGEEFGLGAEIGISTQKLHARGPMGLEELTSSKYVIFGSGQIRE
jgi:glutamate-5-semialdehyde dehydrogenase